MKIFETSKNYFQALGVDEHYAAQNRRLNTRNIRIFLMLVLSIMLNLLYLIFTASNFIEYTNCIYWTSTILVAVLIYAMFVWRMRKVFDYVNKIESLIESSKKNLPYFKFQNLLFMYRFILGSKYQQSKIIYANTNQFVEKWTELINFVLVDVCIPIFSMFMLIFSYVIYFTTDSKEAAFEISFPMW